MIPKPWPDELHEPLSAALELAGQYEQEHALPDAAYDRLVLLRRDLLRAGSSVTLGTWSAAEARAQSAGVALLTAIWYELDGRDDLATRWRTLHEEALDRDVG